MAIWNRLISVLDKAVLQWVFPPICIHCKEPIDQNRYFCQLCLELIDNCFLHREDIQLCDHLRGKILCIAFENMGPLYTLAQESHPIYQKLFIEFVKLAYLQSNVFGCDGIIYWNIKTNFPPIAYIAIKMGLAFSLSVYNIRKIRKKLNRPLLLCWQLPNEKEYRRLQKILSEKIVDKISILSLFDSNI
ncbi:MAG: hypothetical protein ACRCSV_05085 [Chlamydiales bacterium]